MPRRKIPILVLPLLALFLLGGTHAQTLNVVATSSSMGALVREVGADHTRLTVLAPPDRDIHHLQARPSMIRDLRRADLVVAIGAELETGWLPVALRQAANPAILPGRRGYFEAAAQVPLDGAGASADRAHGDVHPTGNPHVNMDPLRMADIAQALAERLAELTPNHTEEFRQRAAAFIREINQHLPGWKAAVADAPGALLYHRDADYLFARLGVPILGYIEPVPGVPPTARHIRKLSERLSDRDGMVIHAPYYSSRAPEKLAQTLGWKRVSLTTEPPLEADGKGYLAHIERWVVALAANRP
ncbi:metal ABC transporter substrate-binding protein [Thiohalomonas denitrificans]|uniref:metal ABC transporter substrate-binding protein n=1 Tax=Thiohalomonas denitrificans TaxID=415747 RepID=UPI0026ED216C|nr:metal ABC transporter substrate-binding protein [Thiohalomonas denitrificans]